MKKHNKKTYNSEMCLESSWGHSSNLKLFFIGFLCAKYLMNWALNFIIQEKQISQELNYFAG